MQLALGAEDRIGRFDLPSVIAPWAFECSNTAPLPAGLTSTNIDVARPRRTNIQFQSTTQSRPGQLVSFLLLFS